MNSVTLDGKIEHVGNMIQVNYINTRNIFIYVPVTKKNIRGEEYDDVLKVNAKAKGQFSVEVAGLKKGDRVMIKGALDVNRWKGYDAAVEISEIQKVKK